MTLRRLIGLVSLPMLAVCCYGAPKSESVAARPRSFYGINADPVWDFRGCNASTNQLEEFESMLRQTGAGSVRLPIRWREMEASRGVWNFSSIDRSLQAVPREVEILGVLMSVPSWANGTMPGNTEGWFDVYPATNIVDWANSVEKIVGRFKGRIRYWEIWNEPNGIDFLRPNPDPKVYTELLKAAYKAAKKADPRCKVVLGGLQMNGIIENRWSNVRVVNFLEDLYKAGAGPYFDICNTHPYVLPEEGAEQMMRLTRDTFEVMARYGDAKKPLWLTEVGCGATTEEARKAQALLAADTYRLAAAEPRIARLFWFTLRDLEKDLVGPESSMGLFEFRTGAPKPAFHAFVAARSNVGMKPAPGGP